jgi:transposase
MEPKKRIQYSEAFKRSIVEEVESGKSTVSGICRRYEICSASFYRWSDKYGKRQKVRIFIQHKSETDIMTKLEQKVALLEQQVQELESVLANTQVKLVMAETSLEIIEEEHGITVKKAVPIS